MIFIGIQSNEDGQCESCTLTVLCWVGGGIRLEGGCSGPSWLMTCCVPQLTRNDDSSDIPSVIQQQVSVGGLRSASGSGRPTGLVSTLEGIANLGRNDCEFSQQSQRIPLIPIWYGRFKYDGAVVVTLRFNVREELKFNTGDDISRSRKPKVHCKPQ